MASGCGEQEAGVASGSGWNLRVWLLGVVVRRYRFPHTTYPYSSCICSFLQQHPYFLFIKKKSFSFLFQYFFAIKFYVLNNFSRSINTHTGNYRRPTAAI